MLNYCVICSQWIWIINITNVSKVADLEGVDSVSYKFVRSDLSKDSTCTR